MEDRGTKLAFFDLDGTLVDISDRWYRLHVDIASRHKLTPLVRETYLHMKKEAVPEQEILANITNDTEVIEAYCEERINKIETDEYLAHDYVFPEAENVLDAWSREHRLILLTKRHRQDALANELRTLGISTYFSQVIAGKDKAALLREAFSNDDLQGAFLISDALEDYMLAREEGMNPIVVGYGLRSPEYLTRHGIARVILSSEDLAKLAIDS
ncbi:MAG: HAD hydrolase-like protein [Candidatus Pacebacteria bacterium]|nr:HAD hydrolase-like protein [Candidatus Paceibacterota bacterium]